MAPSGTTTTVPLPCSRRGLPHPSGPLLILLVMLAMLARQSIFSLLSVVLILLVMLAMLVIQAICKLLAVVVHRKGPCSICVTTPPPTEGAVTTHCRDSFVPIASMVRFGLKCRILHDKKDVYVDRQANRRTSGLMDR
jgi:hypothetical protein